MSLKAKVEAVVYAAEEPVTLAQLAAAFSSDVLEEMAAEASAAASAEPAELPAEPADAASAPADAGSDLSQAENAPMAAGSAGSSPERDAEPAEQDEKKAARQRERAIQSVLRRILDQLMTEYSAGDRGMEIREIAGGYRMATKPEYHDAVRGFVKSLKPPMKLSLQALETLAVIAYKQPVTAPEVNEIRGVDSGGVLGSLIGRKLITTAGRKQVIGRPILYRTTKEFLMRFGLKDLNELPSMEEFEKMAGEISEAQAEEDEAAMRSSEEPEFPEDGQVEAVEQRPEAADDAEDEAISAAEPESDDPSQP
jgi:segregation and condensation protein B